MNNGIVVKIEGEKVSIKIDGETKKCGACSLLSLCKGKTIVIEHNTPSLFKEGQEVTLEFDWSKFIKYTFLFFFVPALAFVVTISALQNIGTTLVHSLSVALLLLVIYFVGIHKTFKNVQFFRIG